MRAEGWTYAIAWGIFLLVTVGLGTKVLESFWFSPWGTLLVLPTCAALLVCAWSVLRGGWFLFLELWLAAGETSRALTEKARDQRDGPACKACGRRGGLCDHPQA